MQPQICIVDHSFHQKTRSTFFLDEALESHGLEVRRVWSERWRGGASPFSAPGQEPPAETVVYFQDIPSEKEVCLFGPDRIVLLPMYDDARLRFSKDWAYLKDCRAIAFSREMGTILRRNGLRTLTLQFFPEPGPRPRIGVSNRRLRGFFWQRHDEINWRTVRHLLRRATVETVHLHNAPDPGVRFVRPSPADTTRFRVRETRWFDKREQYLDAVGACDVFFAPRPVEGIGMAFLEAMALGTCVVAPGLPTMSEYIEHGANGILYDQAHPAVPASLWEQVGEIRQKAWESISAGRTMWLNSITGLVAFLTRSELPGQKLKPAGPAGLLLDDVKRVSRRGGEFLQRRVARIAAKWGSP